MPKFIEVTDQKNILHYINTDHIVFIMKEQKDNTIFLSLRGFQGQPFSIKTEMDYEEIKTLMGQ
jgi:hypothetical protein